jgi:hypothetical protein
MCGFGHQASSSGLTARRRPGSVQEGAKRDLGFQPGKRRADAEVDAVAEGDVAGAAATDVEGVGISETRRSRSARAAWRPTGYSSRVGARQTAWFRDHPAASDLDYLSAAVDRLAAFPPAVPGLDVGDVPGSLLPQPRWSKSTTRQSRCEAEPRLPEQGEGRLHANEREQLLRCSHG